MNELSPVQADAGTAVSLIGINPGMARLCDLASSPDMDPTKFKMLVDMFNEQVAIQRAYKIEDDRLAAERAYTAAMNAVAIDMPPVARDAENKQTRSRYAKLESIVKVLAPIYARHGFTLSFSQAEAEDSGRVKLECEVSHVGGHAKRYSMQAPVDNVGIQGAVNKTDIHGIASAMTYLRRYLTTMIFNIVTPDEDDDGNAATHRRTTTEPRTPAPPKTWLEGAMNQLTAMPNGWKWSDMLVKLLGDVPTHEDAKALATAPLVKRNRAEAPEVARTAIDDAFKQARARLDGSQPMNPEPLRQAAASGAFSDVGQNVQPPSDSQTPAFEAVLIEAGGDVVSEPFTNPLAWAHAFMVMWDEANDTVREILRSENEEALIDAAQFPEAASILEDMDATMAEGSVIKTIEPPMVNGRISWSGYIALIKNRLSLDAHPDNFTAWAEAQRINLEGCPRAQQVLAVRAIMEIAGGRGATIPEWVIQLGRGTKKAAPAAAAAAAPAEPTLAATNDERWAVAQIATIEKLATRLDFNRHATDKAVRAVMVRLRNENPELFQRVDAAFAAKHAALPGGNT